MMQYKAHVRLGIFHITNHAYATGVPTNQYVQDGKNDNNYR